MASDLSFNIVALDKASETFLKLAATVDIVQKKLDALDGKKADVDVNVKTDQSTKALDSFTNRWALLSGAIIAGSPAIGAAIIAGVGVGFIAVTAAALKSNADVRQTYTNLWSNVTESTKSATQQLVPVVVASGNQMGAAFQRIGPQMAQAFSATSPMIVALTRGLIELGTNAMPGVVAVMQNGLPTFSALATLAGTMGTAVGHALTEIGGNSQAIGGFITSLGNILSSVLGLAVTLMNDVARVWAANGAQISQAIAGISNVVAGLASGALPILSGALGAAAQIISTLSAVLSPLSGVLGFVATGALAAWAAFKGAGLVTTGIEKLANGALSMASSMDGLSVKAGKAATTMQTTSAAGATVANGLKTAGSAASAASFSFANAASTMAGPLGIAIAGVTVAIGLLSATSQQASVTTEDLKAAQDALAGAFEQSNGAITSNVESTLRAQEPYKTMAPVFEKAGVTQREFTDAMLKGGASYDAVTKKLNDYVAAHTQVNNAATSGRGAAPSKTIDDEGNAISNLLPKLAEFKSSTDAGKQSADDNTKSIQQHSLSLLDSEDGFHAVADAAAAMGVSFDSASTSFTTIGAQAKDTNGSLQDLAVAVGKAALASANAGGTITSTFTDADKAVTQASNAVSQAQHGVEQASRGVADAQHAEAQAAQGVAQAQQGVAAAQHGVEQAQRSLRDAIEGVNTAQYSYTQSLQAEWDAEKALSDARQQAVRDLNAVHDALDNSYTNEASARVRLFDAQQTASGLGINADNAKTVAGQKVTVDNHDDVKAAIDLMSAQNQLAQAINQSTYAKEDSASADRAGINGAAGVVSAQRSVVAAQKQTQDSLKSVQKAQEAVRDASYGVSTAQQGLQRAQQGVTDAAYAQQKAHQAVRDAQYQETAASQQLSTAQANLRGAQDNASRSLDLHTEAGRRNLGMLYSLTDAIRNQFGPTQQGYKAMVDAVATSFGLSTTQAQGYLTQLGLIPKDFKYSVTAVADVDLSPLANFANDKSGYFKGGFRSAGGQLAYAAGGPIAGMGNGTSDDVDLRASAGEWITKKRAVDFYGHGFMDDVNNMRLPRYATGGLVDGNMWGAGAGLGYTAIRNTATSVGVPGIPSLPKYVPPVMPAFGPTAGVTGDRAANKAVVQGVFASMFGWTGPQWDAATRLIMGESGFNNMAQNPTSTAFGMFQFLNPTWGGYGIPKTSDPTQQAIAGGRYIAARYGSPIGAWGAWSSRSPHWYADGGEITAQIAAANSAGSYDNGGPLQPGWNLAYNGTGKPENVRTSAQDDALLKALQSVKSSIDSLAAKEFNGTLRTERGAMLGEVKAAFATLTNEAGF